MTHRFAARWVALSAVLFSSCRSGEVRPVDIYPEDMCAVCRMAFSDRRFASEIISDRDEAYKFDDLSCMLGFRTSRADVAIVATFVMDYDTEQWIPLERATIVETGVHTPMGSGKVAFRDSTRAAGFAREHPQAVGHELTRNGGGT